MQLRLAARVGLKTPATLVTNQREELIEFYHKHEGNIIAKPFYRTFVESDTGYDTILTSKVSRDDLKKNNGLELTPVIFQEYIEKMYELRVTCVGDNVFAAKIDSQASEKTRVDWRNYDFEKVRHTAYDLPVHIKDRCLDLSKELGLKYGAMDFIVTPNNEYVFLENNPNGQWLWIENLTDLPISLSIANEICELLSPRRSL